MSMTNATSATLSVDLSTRSMKVGMSMTGRLSRQKKPSSSRARTAVDFPDPESPVMMTIRILFHLVSQGPYLHARQELFVELPGRMVPHPLEQEVAGRYLDDGGEVASLTHGDAQVGQVDA